MRSCGIGTDVKKLEIPHGDILTSEVGGHGLWEARERQCCPLLHSVSIQLGAENERSTESNPSRPRESTIAGHKSVEAQLCHLLPVAWGK